MKIQNTINPLLDPYAAGIDKSSEAHAAHRTRPEAAPLADGGDTISVSQDAQLLSEARRTAQNALDVRMDKVEALRIQVNNGTYQPDSQLIAASLVREEPWLFRM